MNIKKTAKSHLSEEDENKLKAHLAKQPAPQTITSDQLQKILFMDRCKAIGYLMEQTLLKSAFALDERNIDVYEKLLQAKILLGQAANSAATVELTTEP